MSTTLEIEPRLIRIKLGKKYLQTRVRKYFPEINEKSLSGPATMCNNDEFSMEHLITQFLIKIRSLEEPVKISFNLKEITWLNCHNATDPASVTHFLIGNWTRWPLKS